MTIKDLYFYCLNIRDDTVFEVYKVCGKEKIYFGKFSEIPELVITSIVVCFTLLKSNKVHIIVE